MQSAPIDAVVDKIGRVRTLQGFKPLEGGHLIIAQKSPQ